MELLTMMIVFSFGAGFGIFLFGVLSSGARADMETEVFHLRNLLKQHRNIPVV